MKAVTIEEAMKLYAGVTRKQFQRYILHGKLRARKVGRQWIIPLSELEKMFHPR